MIPVLQWVESLKCTDQPHPQLDEERPRTETYAILPNENSGLWKKDLEFSSLLLMWLSEKLDALVVSLNLNSDSTPF